MKVPLIKPDLPSLDEIGQSFAEILANGRITNFGKYSRQFENEAGDYLGTNTTALSSGTVGLIFALSALDLPKGAKVILPSFSFVATAQAALYAGGEPLFAEIDGDLNISVDDVERLLAENTDIGAVIAVHMYGLPAKADALEMLVRNASQKLGRKIALVFDAAHAFGSVLNGKRVGGFGDAEVFSLSVTKALVSVEGGLLSSNDPELIYRVSCMRNYGFTGNYNAGLPGMNAKMSEFHAIIGLHNLRRIDVLLRERQAKASSYRRKIEETTRFRTIPGMHTFKDFTILVPAGERDALMQFLMAAGIETRAYFYPPIHEQSYFRRYATRRLPNTESLSRSVISLPFFTTITEEEIDYVVTTLAEFGVEP